jgi:hypothetical protein
MKINHAERSGSGALERMTAITNWPRNRLLLALPSSDLQQIMPELEQIRCEREQVLMEADSSLDHVFFPDSGVVSAVAKGGSVSGCRRFSARGNWR